MKITERLTKEGFDFQQTKITEGLSCDIGAALNRLKSYENLFRFWELEDLNFDELKVWKDLTDTLSKKCFELTEYEEMKEKGLLVKTPCRVGDIIYSIENGKKIIKMQVLNFKIFKNRTIIECADVYDGGYKYDLKDFEKVVFITYEEAEKKLKELI